MRIIQIILLVFIIIGITLLFTQKIWLTPFTEFLLSKTEPSPHVQIPDTTDMDTWEWVKSEVSGQGTQFSYPSPIPTRYTHPQEWPPIVSMTSEAFACVQSEMTTLRTIHGTEYCVSTVMEGAAGSTYTTYDYATQQGDFLTHVSFVLRRPQCFNYDEPERNDCIHEQENFDVDALADRIASSVTMQ